jgi:hypothetical protein
VEKTRKKIFKTKNFAMLTGEKGRQLRPWANEPRYEPDRRSAFFERFNAARVVLLSTQLIRRHGAFSDRIGILCFGAGLMEVRAGPVTSSPHKE